MILDLNSETKRQISDNIVRHCHRVMSAKASDVLRYFSQHFLDSDLNDTWMDGFIYFSDFSSPFFATHLTKTDPTFTEVIALCPKWLLIAHTIHPEIYTVRRDRNLSGHYKTHSQRSSVSDYFDQLRLLNVATDSLKFSNHSNSHSVNHHFTGGLAGFIGYDMAAQHHADVQISEDIQSNRLIAALGDYDFFLKKELGGWALYGSDDPRLTPLVQRITQALDALNQQINPIQPIIESDPPQVDELNNITIADRFTVQSPFRPVWSFEQYAAAFTRIQDYLRAGDCYQVNLTQPFIATIKGDLLAVMDDLFALTKAPYSGYMRIGEHELLSCSPELFLAFSGMDTLGQNQVMTRPIKGTRPRSDDAAQDSSERDALIQSSKDQSENLMIVDLLRNDLSLHAVVGSVAVPALFELESFAQVHHLVSEVRATLRQDVSALDVLIDALPGGSITGAPKIRAMEIIAELEAAPRGAYCGSFGFLNRDGSGQFNVLIRTLQKHQDQVVAWAGGGITIASEVEAEYQECLDKISAILDCVNGFRFDFKEKSKATPL
jgi:para-aminobenzoate synthetase component 1